MDKLQLNEEEYKTYGNYFEISERKKLIGEAMEGLRKGAGLSQSELAEKLDIKSGTYSTYENGTREAPAEIIVRMAILFGCSTDYILQVSRYRYENFISSEQFEQVDKDIAEIRKLSQEKELNPEFKAVIDTITNAFADMTVQLKELNETAVPKGQE